MSTVRASLESPGLVGTANEDAPIQPFRLFDLPGELRLAIYEFALAPTGTLHLTSTPSKRFAVEPAPNLSLLTTNHQVHCEAAAILYTENAVCITIDAHDTCWPTISERRLPQRVLVKLQHLFVILNCTSSLRASYDDVDFDAFSALISLATMRLALIARVPIESQDAGLRVVASEEDQQAARGLLLRHILERIPARAAVSYGTKEGTAQQAILLDSVERCVDYAGTVIEQASGKDMALAVGLLQDLERGKRSDATRDVYQDFNDRNFVGKGRAKQ